MRKVFKSFLSKSKQAYSAISPSFMSMRLAGISLLVFAALFFGVSMFSMMQPLSFVEIAITILVFLALSVLGALLADLLLTWIMKAPVMFRLGLVTTLIVFLFLLGSVMPFVFLAIGLLVLLSLFIGAALFNIKNDRKKPVKKPKVFTNYAGLIIGFGGIIAGVLWLLHPGRHIEYPENAALFSDYRPPRPDVANPAEKGVYSVSYLTYGSGNDKRRPEYGEDTGILSPTVDGSALLKGWTGRAGNMRTRSFGFDAARLPLNALVWYPAGEGPFPLVLIVHGNHFGLRFSDPGYAWLGRHLASRGFILASVDQNFLNGMHTDIFGKGLGKENDARGWLLLEHLKLWEGWNDDPGSHFYRKVDMDKIALIGHSRGGEAVGHAAVFNKLPYYPDDANKTFDYNFNISSIVAIAPVDGQYRPSGVLPPLNDISYLSLQGSHDADLRSFDGARMFERLRFTHGFDGFGALVYIFGANHGQFNSRWGRRDFSSPMINLYNLAQLMPFDEQQHIGKFFITAFLEASLGMEPEYRSFFADYRSCGDWLPPHVYITQFRSPAMVPLMTFDEDLDLTTCIVEGAAISARNLTDWYESRIHMKFYPLESRGVYLGWDNYQSDTLLAEYTLTLPHNVEAGNILYLMAADSGNEPSWREHQEDYEGNHEDFSDAGENEQDPSERFIDFTIQLVDVNGECISFPLSSNSYLQPQLKAYLGKIPLVHPKPFGEPVLQSFFFPLNDYLYQNPLFDTGKITGVSLRFDRSESGMIILSELGFMDEFK